MKRWINMQYIDKCLTWFQKKILVLKSFLFLLCYLHTRSHLTQRKKTASGSQDVTLIHRCGWPGAAFMPPFTASLPYQPSGISLSFHDQALLYPKLIMLFGVESVQDNLIRRSCSGQTMTETHADFIIVFVKMWWQIKKYAHFCITSASCLALNRL